MVSNDVTVESLPQQFRFRQERIALPLTGLLTSALVMVPVLVLVRVSLAPSGTMPFAVSTLTAENYTAIFLDPVT